MKQAQSKQPKGEEVLKAAEAEILHLKEEVQAAQEREKRALADYQNLQRRSMEERMAFIKMANKDLCQALLQPLEHLSLAAQNIEDRGLNIVVEQFWKELQDFGLEEVEVLGQKFDLNIMEAVEKKGNGEKVIEVVRKAYKLNGEIIQHAQVVLA
jgi:molecular chaperone GrpE